MRDLGYQVETAFTAVEGREKATLFRPDIILLDVHLPDILGLELLGQIKEKQPSTTVIMMTGSGTVKHAVDAMRKGAEDYLTKPLDLDELQVLLEKITANLNLRQEVADLKNALREGYAKDYLFLSSPAMGKVYGQIEKVAAQVNVSVLILGETGTGKEHVARLIHLFRRGPPSRSLNSIAEPFPNRSWSPNYSATRQGLSPTPRSKRRGSLKRPRAVRCSWTRWGRCPSRSKLSC